MENCPIVEQIILWVTGPKYWETILTKYYTGKKQCVMGE